MKWYWKAVGLLLCLATIILLPPAVQAGEVKDCSDALHELGVFRGDGESFAPFRDLRRDEAAVMLVRLLGGEAEALEVEYASPFTDIADWFRPYAGWLWHNGLTRGVSADSTVFAPENSIGKYSYLRFLLRALGYIDDVNGHFEVLDFDEFLVEYGFFGEGELHDLVPRSFNRFNCAKFTVRALGWPMKDGGGTLSDALVAKGVFTRESFDAVLDALADSVVLSPDGRLIRAHYRKVPLLTLGLSNETYTGIGWSLDSFSVAYDEEGAVWFVDNETLTRKCRLSEYEIELASERLYDGALYFYEYPDGKEDAKTLIVKRYDGNKTVSEVLRTDHAVYYGKPSADPYLPDGWAYIEIAEVLNGIGQYRIVDLATGEVQTIFSAPGAAYFTPVHVRRGSGLRISGTMLLTVRREDGATYAMLGGSQGELLGSYETTSSATPRGEGAVSIWENNGDCHVLDGGVFLQFDWYGGITSSYELDCVIISACDTLSVTFSDTLFLLDSSTPSGMAHELIVIPHGGGESRVLLDASVLVPLGINRMGYATDEYAELYRVEITDTGSLYFEQCYHYFFETGRVEEV